MGRRGAEQDRQARMGAATAMPPPPVPLSERELQFYAGAMAAVVPQARDSAVVQMLCAGIAQAKSEVEACTLLIETEGLVVACPQGVKPNPAVAIRDQAMKRIAALASRIKATPQGDARELQRAARYEQAHRSSAPVVAGTGKVEEGFDWVRELRRMQEEESADLAE